MLPKRTAVFAELPVAALTCTVAPAVGVVKTAPRRTLLLKKSAGIAFGVTAASAVPSQLTFRNPFAKGPFVVLLTPPSPTSVRNVFTAAVMSAGLGPAAVETLGAAEPTTGVTARMRTERKER